MPRQKLYFRQLLIVAGRPRSQKWWPFPIWSVGRQWFGVWHKGWFFAVDWATIPIDKFPSSLVEYSKPYHFHNGVGEFGRVEDRRFARKSMEIKEKLPLFPISVKSLIIEELDLFNNFINFELAFIHQREAPTNRIRVRGLISRMQCKQTGEPYKAILRD